MGHDLQWVTASFIENYLMALNEFTPSPEINKYRAKAEEILRITLKSTDELIIQSCHQVLHNLITCTASYRLTLQLKEMQAKKGNVLKGK